jgi:hypothetical protein
MVLNGSVSDLKSSSLWFLGKADVLVRTSVEPFAWPHLAVTLLQNKVQFSALPPLYENRAFIEEIRSRKKGLDALKASAARADLSHR